MKNVIRILFMILATLSMAILFAGCGTKTIDDYTGEYVWIEDGKEQQENNKHYYLMVLQKDIYDQNKPAVQVRFSEERYNPDLGKKYYVNRDFYIDPKTLQSFELETYHFLINDRDNVILNNVEYKKISSTTLTPEDTSYTARNLKDDLEKIPKFNEMAHTRVHSPIGILRYELDDYVYY